ncbi:MAG: hypothetical protein GTN78_19940 [Gemmatimonadales bacterium]|nr:hypothetical protein [Gemmatimonadales bacterium]
MTVYGRTPAEEDPELHRHLEALTQFSPGVGFENRVMARVYRPAPAWLRTARAAGRDAVETGRAWTVLGVLSAGSLVSWAVAVGFILEYAAQIGAGLRWFFGTGLPYAWETVTAYVAELLATVYTLVSAWAPSGGALAAAAALSFLGLVACAWGLYRTMEAPSAVRA